MELSPRLLRDVEFGEQWRGYNQAEVDEFLERVAAALDSLVARFQETTARAEAAERRLLERGDDDEIRRTLVLAQRTAAAAVEEARAEAERIVAAADAQVAERLAASEERLRTLEEEIQQRTRDELAALDAQRQALLADVDALGAFVDEHRNRLAGELRRELAWLERPELQVPAPPGLQADDVPSSTPPAVEPAPEVDVEAEPGPASEPEAPAAEEAPAGSDDIAAAREELERALSGMEEVEDPSPGRQIFDVLADPEEPPAGDVTGVFDVLAEADEHDDADLQWRDEPPAPAGSDDDDPFLAELRKAITDDDPLGPRDHVALDDEDSEPAGSGWFRRRHRG